MNYEDCLNKLKRVNQEHLLKFFDELNDGAKESLLSQIEKIDFDFMNKLFDEKDNLETANKEITPIVPFDKERMDVSEYASTGVNIISSGKLAICSMAGGQGTRLGFNGPKGTYMLDLDKPTSIFETIINKLKDAEKKLGVLIYWYVMTSEINNDETVKFFEDNNFFGYDREHIIFFKQGELPLIGKDGKIVLKDKGQIFMAPDGNGGIFKALEDKKILDHMKAHDIKYLAVGNVDNILINMIDENLIGLMDSKKLSLASKSFLKSEAKEKCGVFCKINGRPSVIEYFEIPEDIIDLKNDDDEFVYGDAHIGCNFFSISLLEKIANQKLPMHAAVKKNTVVDEEGNLVEKEAYKFEAFIFDAFNMADDVLVYRIKRNEEFAPIKNKEGNDSPETAIKLYKEFYNLF